MCVCGTGSVAVDQTSFFSPAQPFHHHWPQSKHVIFLNMICCCAKDVSADSSKDKVPDKTPSSIHTGQGALSSSNQNISEADLDKTTVSATKREKSPITEQPTSVVPEKLQSQEQPAPQSSPVNDSKPNKPEETKSESQNNLNDISKQNSSKPAVDLSQIEPKFVSNISVGSKDKSPPPPPSYSVNTDLDKPILSQLSSLEKSVSEVESSSSYSVSEGKRAGSDLALQLKALTSQVLTAAQSHNMADLESVLKRLEAVTARLENVADGRSGGAAAAGGDSGEFC